MNITRVEIKLRDGSESADDKLLAYAAIELDGDFVIKDLKIIQRGLKLFVSMPSRRRTDHCEDCWEKNALGAKFCNQCGTKLTKPPPEVDEDGERVRRYVDIAHPTNREGREVLHQAVVDAYFEKLWTP